VSETAARVRICASCQANDVVISRRRIEKSASPAGKVQMQWM
jgi:hypothetical protein